MSFTNLIGYTAAFATTCAFVPQALKTVRERDTRSLSLSMYVIFTVGVYLWTLYGFIKNDGALIAANVPTALLSTWILLAKLRNVIRYKEPI